MSEDDDMSGDDEREKYYKRYANFSNGVDFMQLQKKLEHVPGEKSHWAYQLSKAEVELYNLEKRKKYMISTTRDKTIQQNTDSNSPVSLNKSTLDKQISNTTAIIDIDEEIKQKKMTIDLLQNLYNCVQYIAKDFDNIIRFMALNEG